MGEGIEVFHDISKWVTGFILFLFVMLFSVVGGVPNSTDTQITLIEKNAYSSIASENYTNEVHKNFCGGVGDAADCEKKYHNTGFMEKMEVMEYKDIVKLQNENSKINEELGLF